MLRSYKSSLLVVPAVLLAGLYINTNVFADSNDVDFSITVKPSLTLALSSNTVNFSITPTAQGVYNSANFTVTSATNNAYGYTLVMGTSNVDLTSNTINPITGTNPIIPTLTETQDGISAATFEASTDSSVLNHYGVAIGTGNNFNAMKTSNPIKKTNANNASGVDTTTIALASKLDLATVPGTYSTTINFQMIANPLPGGLEEAYQNAGKTKKTIGGKQYYAMQDMTSAICSNVTVEDDVIEVYDTRDDTIYHIGKLTDDKCWLLDDLALNLADSDVQINLNPSNTNADQTSLDALIGKTVRDPNTDPDGGLSTGGVITGVGSYTLPAVSVREIGYVSQDSLDSQYGWKLGASYNLCAAAAGSYCYSSSAAPDESGEQDYNYDICPYNWRVPVKSEFVPGLQDYIDAGYTAFRISFRAPDSNAVWCTDETCTYPGTYTYTSYWTSTFYSKYAFNAFGLKSGTFYTSDIHNRQDKYKMRCVAK